MNAGRREQMNELLVDLNEPQREAVSHRDGPLLVLAGPGSGKTRVITRRAAYLTLGGVAPSSILAITFTNKATDEMRRRILALGVGRGMWVYTFHALGARLLREFGSLANVYPGFTIYDESDQIRTVKRAIEIANVGESVKPEQCLHKISHAKNELKRPEDIEQTAGFFEDRAIARVYAAYQALLEQANAVDFDDLLSRVALLLRDNAGLCAQLSDHFQYILIDEYQDTNYAQYLIAKQLASSHRNLCVTGDPDQSIYRWRGANLNNILDFEHDYPEARVVRLEQNYRSKAKILKVASALISQNHHRKRKELWTENPPGEVVRVWQFADGRGEAEQIAEEISRERVEGRNYGDIAIFFRVAAISRGVEEALRARGIPYRMVRGVEFFNRAEIKDTVAYLRLMVNPRDDVSVLRVLNNPPRGIGDKSARRIQHAATESKRCILDVLRDAEMLGLPRKAATAALRFVEMLDEMRGLAGGSVAAAVRGVLHASGLERALRDEDEDGGEDRLANVEELINEATLHDTESETPTLEAFLERISLVSDQDAIDTEAGAVLLMTLHAAKGLEFPVVFITGLEQGLLPHERSLRDNDVEEERRLLFVGITRARERLFLSFAMQRLLRGVLMPRSRSQFLGELDYESIEEKRFGQAPRWGQADWGGAPQRKRWDEAGEFDAAPPRRRFGSEQDEPVFSPNDPVNTASLISERYRDWTSGALVRHTAYGVGRLVWIRAGAGNTRASIQFPGVGQKTLILELSPVERVKTDHED